MNITLDDWQKKVLDTKGNLVLRSGRQVGKSTVVSIKAAEYAVNNKGKTILVVAAVERQALLLFEKILGHLADHYKAYIKKGKDRPTKHKITLNNGSTIYSLPTGLSGYGIRGYTVDLLIADEAAFIPEAVWTAVTPMLAMTGGILWMLSTPFGRGGYFYKAFSRDNFTKFHVNTEDVLKFGNREEHQKSELRIHLDEEKKSMSDLQYAQEYLGEFIDELRQFFPTNLIQSCMTLQQLGGGSSESPLFSPSAAGGYFLGVDVARMGGDETVLVSLHRNNRKILNMVDLDITRRTLLTETVWRIKNADKKYKYKRIYIDDGGMGVGVFDPLLGDSQTRRKVVAINNASRSIERPVGLKDVGRRKKLLKEDLYNNLLNLMESRKLFLFDNPEIMLSLKSVQFEFKEGRLKIFGKYTHITEALIRAAWCVKDKRLNIWVL